MEKKRYTGIAVFLIAAMMSACLLTACFEKKELLSCVSANAAAISGVDFSKGVITLYFDKERVSGSEMNDLFEGTGKNIRVNISGKYGAEEFGPANIKIDRELKRVEISTGMNSADYISSILLFCNRNQLSLDLKESKLVTRVIVSTEGEIGPLRGRFTTTYRITTQSYDEAKHTWSKPVQETFDMSIDQ